MTSFMQLILALAVIIVAAKISGYISYSLGQPSVLGEIVVGILLGPSVLDVFHLPYFSDGHLSTMINDLAELGVLLLMFIAGIDLHLKDLAQASKGAILAGTIGMIIPLLLGMGTGMAFDMEITHALFLGLTLSATSVSISAQTLRELNAIRSRVGITMLGAAVIDDILVVLGLSVFTALILSDGSAGWGQVAQIAVSMVLFLIFTSLIGYFLLPKFTRFIDRLPISQGLAAFTFVLILLYGWLAEAWGNMAAITGAFLAGLWLSRSPLRERISSSISVLAYGVFVPIFFINIGLSANLRNVTGGFVWLLVVMTVIAIVGKLLGAGLGAKLSGFTNRESLQLGVGMMSRGEVGLIVAAIGSSTGFISQDYFSAVVGVVIITTLLTPPSLRFLFAKTEPKENIKEDETKKSETDSQLKQGEES